MLIEKKIEKEINVKENEIPTCIICVGSTGSGKSATIAKDLGLENRMTRHTTNECYVTLKDHKDEFMDRMPCRLINPAKTDIQKVSKRLLDEINQEVRYGTNLHQWKNTQAVQNLKR